MLTQRLFWLALVSLWWGWGNRERIEWLRARQPDIGFTGPQTSEYERQMARWHGHHRDPGFAPTGPEQ